MNDHTVILGLGNALCGDDGVGTAAIAAFARRYRLPPGDRVVDGGTLGLSLLPYLTTFRNAVLVDAVRADAPPGTIVELVGDAILPVVRERLSVHQVGVADLLDATRWRSGSLPLLRLVGVVPRTLALGVGLSAPVRAALPDLVERIAELVQSFGGHAILRGEDDAADRNDPALVLARVLGM